MKKALILLAVLVLLQGVTVGAQEEEVYNPEGVTWNANSEADLAGYTLYEGTTAGGPYTPLHTILAPATEFSFTAATPHPDGKFYWVCTAYDLAGNESGYSNEATASFDTGPPAPPTGCTPMPRTP